MRRDSLYGEEIVWSGGPRGASVPIAFKLAAVVAGVAAVCDVVAGVGVVCVAVGAAA